MFKQELIKEILNELDSKLAVIKEAAKTSHETASNQEFAPKSKYDTFALEESYLANGQSKRAQELEDAILTYKNLHLKNFTKNSKIEISALIQLEKKDGNCTQVFFGPAAGGLVIKHPQTKERITIVTPDSPLGKQIENKEINDIIEVQQREQILEYEIIKIE